MNQSVTRDSVRQALADTRKRIADAAAAAGRNPDSVKLLAVSKRKDANAIRAAYSAGQRDFGENYVDEAVAKIDALELPEIRWHFIGSIQSRKTSDIAARFDWVHSIEREKVARRLSAARTDRQPPLNCCIQLNLDNEVSKSGVSLDRLDALCAVIDELPALVLRGLMIIPAPRDNPADQRTVFARVADAMQQRRQQWPTMDTLSMGMSGDLEAAIAEGASIVRVGTAIFGERTN